MNWLIDFSIGSTRYEDRANFDRASNEAQFSVQEKRQILCIVKEFFYLFFRMKVFMLIPRMMKPLRFLAKKTTLVAILVFIFKPYQRKTLCRYSRLFENSAIPKLTTDPPNVTVVYKSSDILALGMNGKGSARGLACEDHFWEAPLNAENISTWILCIFANAEAFTWPFQRLENGLLAFSSHFWLVPPRATASI